MTPARRASLRLLMSRTVYDETSISCLRWRMDIPDKKDRGNVAGGLHPSGYWHVRCNSHSFRVHRVIWIMHNGYIRDSVLIDHINNKSCDNRINNLQTTTAMLNVRKRRRAISNTSGFTGVTFIKRDQVWIMTIKVNKKRIYLGRCRDPAVGASVYDRAYILRSLYDEVDIDLCWSSKKIKVTSKQKKALEMNIHSTILNNNLKTYLKEI